MAINRQQIELIVAGGCGIPGCDHESHKGQELYFHCMKHIGGRIEVSYKPGSGILRVGCKECGNKIGEFVVGDVEVEI